MEGRWGELPRSAGGNTDLRSVTFYFSDRFDSKNNSTVLHSSTPTAAGASMMRIAFLPECYDVQSL